MKILNKILSKLFVLYNCYKGRHLVDKSNIYKQPLSLHKIKCSGCGKQFYFIPSCEEYSSGFIVDEDKKQYN